MILLYLEVTQQDLQREFHALEKEPLLSIPFLNCLCRKPPRRSALTCPPFATL
jgi:hypothetical protein